jgi:hypothetical protein
VGALANHVAKRSLFNMKRASYYTLPELVQPIKDIMKASYAMAKTTEALSDVNVFPIGLEDTVQVRSLIAICGGLAMTIYGSAVIVISVLQWPSNEDLWLSSDSDSNLRWPSNEDLWLSSDSDSDLRWPSNEDLWLSSDSDSDLWWPSNEDLWLSSFYFLVATFFHIEYSATVESA